MYGVGLFKRITGYDMSGNPILESYYFAKLDQATGQWDEAGNSLAESNVRPGVNEIMRCIVFDDLVYVGGEGLVQNTDSPIETWDGSASGGWADAGVVNELTYCRCFKIWKDPSLDPALRVDTAEVLAVGTDASKAAAITAGENFVNGADGAAGVILPSGSGDAISIRNLVPVDDLLVYPPDGGTINGSASAYLIPGSTTVIFEWDTDDAFTVFVPAEVLYAGGYGYQTGGGETYKGNVIYTAEGGPSWTQLPILLSDNAAFGAQINDMEVHDDGTGEQLWLAGNIRTVSGGFTTVRLIIKWDGTAYNRFNVRDDGWSGLVSGGGVNALCSAFGVLLYGGGEVYHGTDGEPSNPIGYWDGNACRSLPGQTLTCSIDDPDVNMMRRWTDPYDNVLKVAFGGIFNIRSALRIDGEFGRVAMFIDTADPEDVFTALASLDNTVRQMLVFNGDLYAFGDFTGNAAKYVNGAWEILGSFNGSIRSACVATVNGSDAIVMGGSFTLPNKGLAYYDGSNVYGIGDQSRGGGPATVWQVIADTTNGDGFTIVGDFDKVCGEAGHLGVAHIEIVSSVETVTAYNSGTLESDQDYSTVRCCVIAGGYLYVGGNIREIGGTAVLYGAKMQLSAPDTWVKISDELTAAKRIPGDCWKMSFFNSQLITAGVNGSTVYLRRYDSGVPQYVSMATLSRIPECVVVSDDGDLYIDRHDSSSGSEVTRLWHLTTANWTGTHVGCPTAPSEPKKATFDAPIHTVCHLDGDLHCGGEFEALGELADEDNTGAVVCLGAVTSQLKYEPILGGVGSIAHDAVSNPPQCWCVAVLDGVTTLGDQVLGVGGDFGTVSHIVSNYISGIDGLERHVVVAKGCGGGSQTSAMYPGVYALLRISETEILVGGCIREGYNPDGFDLEPVVRFGTDGTDWQGIGKLTKVGNHYEWSTMIGGMVVNNVRALCTHGVTSGYGDERDGLDYIWALHDGGVSRWHPVDEEWADFTLNITSNTYFDMASFDDTIWLFGEGEIDAVLAHVLELNGAMDEWLDSSPTTLEVVNYHVIGDIDGTEKMFVCGSSTSAADEVVNSRTAGGGWVEVGPSSGTTMMSGNGLGIAIVNLETIGETLVVGGIGLVINSITWQLAYYDISGNDWIGIATSEGFGGYPARVFAVDQDDTYQTALAAGLVEDITDVGDDLFTFPNWWTFDDGRGLHLPHGLGVTDVVWAATV